MKHRFWLPAAALLLLTAAPGRAQTSVGSGGITPMQSGGITSMQGVPFVNQQGVPLINQGVPLFTQGVPFVSGLNTFPVFPSVVAIDPRFAMFPGFGSGYYPWGPISLNPTFVDLRPSPMFPFPANTLVPVLGVNVPPAGVGRPVVGQRRAAERVAGARQETPQTNPEQVALATRMATIMEDRPMRQGTVARVGATGVQVRFDVNGETRVERYPITDVFFFQENGDLATAATSPGSLREGQQVLVPEQRGEPVVEENRQTGAEGTREAPGGENIVIRPAAQVSQPATNSTSKAKAKPAAKTSARKTSVKPGARRR